MCCCMASFHFRLFLFDDESLTLTLVWLCLFIRQSLRTYFSPSNADHWTHLQANFFLTYVLQLCRNVSHSLASTVISNTSVSLRYLPALHLPTLQYLVTNLLPFALEGLYSKHPHLSQYSSACIKNLVAVYPSVCEPIVLRFLLTSAFHCRSRCRLCVKLLFEYVAIRTTLYLKGEEGNNYLASDVTVYLHSMIYLYPRGCAVC